MNGNLGTVRLLKRINLIIQRPRVFVGKNFISSFDSPNGSTKVREKVFSIDRTGLLGAPTKDFKSVGHGDIRNMGINKGIHSDT